ncbi:MAG: hypothetical protein IPJ65_19785 [Archangiaceae bacterium]|nr:hypothetical protein [Archangiaceae bacterium]
MTALEGREYLVSSFPVSLAPLASPELGALTLQVLVPGASDCRIHYRIAPEGIETHAGLANRPDVTLSLQLPELEALSRGRLDVGEAVALNHVQLFGDKAKAALISKRLEARGAVWGAR